MIENTTLSPSSNDNDVVYQAHLHLIIFLGPIAFLCAILYAVIAYPQFHVPCYVLGIGALLWIALTGLTYLSSYLIIKNKQVILCTGILMRQTIDIPISKVECVDIRQSILGSMFNYGALVITGTGGSRQFINYLNKPLTCRRYIEQIMHG